LPRERPEGAVRIALDSHMRGSVKFDSFISFHHCSFTTVAFTRSASP
jgi:hypothetical protein